LLEFGAGVEADWHDVSSPATVTSNKKTDHDLDPAAFFSI
jgi:hypothetical protein